MTLLIDFLCEMEFRYGGNDFRSSKIDSLFGKVKLHGGDFQFCTDGVDIHFGEIQMEKVQSAFIRSAVRPCNMLEKKR